MKGVGEEKSDGGHRALSNQDRPQQPKRQKLIIVKVDMSRSLLMMTVICAVLMDMMKKIYMMTMMIYINYKDVANIKVCQRFEVKYVILYRCFINSKLSNLIIDSDSCENIIGKHAANTLKLQLEPLPEPYKINGSKL